MRVELTFILKLDTGEACLSLESEGTIRQIIRCNPFLAADLLKDVISLSEQRYDKAREGMRREFLQ